MNSGLTSLQEVAELTKKLAAAERRIAGLEGASTTISKLQVPYLHLCSRHERECGPGPSAPFPESAGSKLKVSRWRPT